MSPSTNTHSSLIIPTEAITFPTLTYPYMIQTNFPNTIANTIKYLLGNFDDNNSKQDEKFKQTIEEIIAKQDTNYKINFRYCHFR